MSNLRQAAQQALEALENAYMVNSWAWVEQKEHVITALRAALAEPEQEPVAWKLVPVKPTNEMLKAMDECSTEGYDERLLAGHAASVYMAAVDVSPLFTAFTPRKPLTDEELEPLLDEVESYDSTNYDLVKFARAIERAHGIGEQHE